MENKKDFKIHSGLVKYIERMNGTQWRFGFDNGYGASVITG